MTNDTKGFVNTPQFPGLQKGATIGEVRKLIKKQVKTKGFNWSIANGFSSFNLELSGTARVFLGFSLMPVVADAGAISITAMAEEFNLTIDELGDTLDTDMSGLTRAMEIFGEQMGQNIKAPSGKKKAKAKLKS